MSNVTRILATVLLAAFSVGPVSAATVSNASATIAQNANAGATSGAVQGTVKDETGAPVSGATVIVRGATTYTSTTDAAGAFAIANINPGLYTVEISKAGFDAATEPDFAVAAGVSQTIAATIHARSFQNLRTIATVRATGRGVFNTTSASVNTVSAQTIRDEAAPQVMQVLNQTPGIVASLPQSTANAASPGAITFPNIRGALSFETASLIDGHPVSVGQYGDYVTSFLNGYSLGGIEVVKGPGANAPQVNYAIGGTVNFITREPSFKPDGDITLGVNNHGGTMSNFGFSGTYDRLGVVLDLATNDDPGAFNHYPAYYSIGGNQTWIGTTPVSFNDSASTVAGTQTNVYTNYGLVACCQNISGDYNNRSELVKLRYKFSDATTATMTYLGSQTDADQNANTSSQINGTFTPGTGGTYTGSIAAGSPLLVTALHPGTDHEINNEPIIEGDVRTLLGTGTLLGRFYSAGIHRLINQGGDNPSQPFTTLVNLWGTNCGGSTGCPATAANTFNGGLTPVTYYNYYRQAENDRMNGWSLEYAHPFGSEGRHMLTLAYDSNVSQTQSYSVSASTSLQSGAIVASPNFSVGIPDGSSQRFGTFLARGLFDINPKMNATLSLFSNTYRSTSVAACPSTGCLPDGSNATFQTTNRTHFDPRVGFEFRPTNDLAVRFAAGSAIAPPYLNLLSSPQGVVKYTSGNQFATQNVNAGGLLPETAFGYDLGASYRFKDKVTFLSGDVYTTTLYNHFISSTYNSGLTCTPSVNAACPATGVPIYYTGNVNLNLSRYQGLEVQLRRMPATGLGYALQGSLMRGYAYNLPPCFYSTTPSNCNALNTNVAIVPNVNFNGGTGFGPVQGQLPDGSGTVGFAKIGFSNQNIPYLMGYAELNYTLPNGAKFILGDTLYGKNNSLNRPPFGVANFTAKYPIQKDIDVQVSGYNVFNAYNGLFPVWNGPSVAIPLANGQLGATEANVIGPSTWRFLLTKHIGTQP